MAVRVDYLAKETGNNFWRNASLTLGTILTVAIALSLVGLAIGSQRAVGNLSGRFEDEIEFDIWLTDPVDNRADCDGDNEALRTTCEEQEAQYARTIARIENDLESSELVQEENFVDRAQTFIEFQEFFADSPQILDLVTQDAMPESFRVIPASTDPGLIEDFRERYVDEPGVRAVSAAEDLLENVQRFSQITGWLMNVAAGVAGLAASLLMYNSIRTAVFARRREIEVMSLVGASKWFIRIPFMLEAFIQGVIGATVSVLFVWAANRWFLPQIEEIGSTFQGLQLDVTDQIGIGLLLILAGGALGLVSSFVAVTKYLDA